MLSSFQAESEILRSVAIIKEAANRQTNNGTIHQKQIAASTTTEVATEGPPVEANTSTVFSKIPTADQNNNAP